MDKDLGKNLGLIVNKAQRSLLVAKEHLEKGHPDFASSKAYYAVFHIMQGALLTLKLSFSRHSAVISAFNQHFIKTGVLPKESSKIIERLFKNRQIGDYDYLRTISPEEAKADVEDAEKMVEKVVAYLRKEGWL